MDSVGREQNKPLFFYLENGVARNECLCLFHSCLLQLFLSFNSFFYNYHSEMIEYGVHTGEKFVLAMN